MADDADIFLSESFNNGMEFEDILMRNQQYAMEIKNLQEEIARLKDREIPKPYLIAMHIVESEPFTWLMVGSNHPESNINALKNAYAAWKESGGKSVFHKNHTPTPTKESL